MFERLWLAVSLALGAAAPALAQLPPGLPVPPENYAATHFWGSPSVISIRHVAMGGAYVADNRSDWHGNPAGMVAIERPTVLISHTVSEFRSLPTFRSGFVGYAQPIGSKERDVVKLTLVPVRASGRITNTPVPIHLRAEENDVGVEFARRVNDRLSVGVAASYLQTESSYRIDGVGTVTTLKSRPRGFGGRVGAIYDVHPSLSLGLTYDRYSEKVTRRVPAFQLPSQSFDFDSTVYRAGAAVRPDTRTTLLVDYESLRVAGGGTEVEQRFWMAGVERQVGDIRLRVGTFDGKLTGGVGWQRGRAELAYGFTGRYDKSLPGQGARTAHAVSVLIHY